MTKLLIPRPSDFRTREPVAQRAIRLRGYVADRPQQRQTTPPVPPTRKMIEQRAYFLFLERGGTPGDSAADWATAEQQAWAEYHQELATFRQTGQAIPERGS